MIKRKEGRAVCTCSIWSEVRASQATESVLTGKLLSGKVLVVFKKSNALEKFRNAGFV